jgi:hypothetical protein
MMEQSSKNSNDKIRAPFIFKSGSEKVRKWIVGLY